MTKNSNVATPEKKIATLGSNPIRIGASTVEPNMATTCCRPAITVCPVGRRSSGITSPEVFSVHFGK